MKPQHIDAWLAQLGKPSADRDYKPGHARMHALLKPLHCVQPKLRIRVVGTNGKGSTATMLAAGLQATGLTIGLYTSPHILTFHERIRINGEDVSNIDLLRYLEIIMPNALQVQASYFEVATALALHHFSQHKVDIEILEAGVGARLDATTAVPADMALITPIGLDHQVWLGDSLIEVACEKAYALDGCRWGLTAPQAISVMPVLKQHMRDIQETTRIEKSCGMLGEHQHINAGLVCGALDVLADEGFIHADDIQAIKYKAIQAKALGRLQYVVRKQAHIWLDAAHNRHAVEALLPTLPNLADPFDAILVYTREDRSLHDCMALLSPLSKCLISDEVQGEHIYIPTVQAALQYALALHPQAKILLLGSFTSVAAGLRWLEEG